MDRLLVKRKWKFASVLLPFWVIPSYITKSEFKQKYHLESDLCEYDFYGQPIKRIDIAVLDAIGVRISSGQTIELVIKEGVESLFASTVDGSLSNEVYIKDIKSNSLYLTAKGGVRTVSYPYIEEVT